MEIKWDFSKPVKEEFTDFATGLPRKLRLELRKLSDLQATHGVNDEHVGRVEDAVARGDGVPLLVGARNSYGRGEYLRDGHHRQTVLQRKLGQHAVVPVWILGEPGEPGTPGYEDTVPGHDYTPWKPYLETPEAPVKLAAQAPAGGAVVNNQFTPGGRFLPRLLGRIRDVRARKKGGGAVVRLARKDQTAPAPHWTPGTDVWKHATGLHYQDVAGHHSLSDRVQETGDPVHVVIKRSPAFNEWWDKLIEGKNPSAPFGGFTAALGHSTHEGYVHGDHDSPFSIWHQMNGPPGKRFHRLSVTVGANRFVAPVTREELRAVMAYHRWAGKRTKVRQALESGLGGDGPVPLARRGEKAPMSAQKFLPKGTLEGPQKTLRPQQIRAIEDRHGFEDHDRLPFDTLGDGTVSSSVDEFASWLDRLAAKRLPAADLGHVLSDPTVTDEEKATHVFNHAHDESSAALRRLKNGMDWYGGAVSKLDTSLHHLLSREVPFDPASRHVADHPLWGRYNPETGKTTPGPGIRLMKAVMAFTSSNQKPVDNLAAALRALKSGMRNNPADPFRSIDPVDYGRLARWEADAKARSGGDPGHVTAHPPKSRQGLLDALEWTRRHATKDEGYAGLPVLFDKATGEPVAFVGGKGQLRPVPGFSGDAHAMKADNRLVTKHLPLPGGNGRLQPKGWGTRAGNIAKAIDLLKRIIDHHGGDYDAAADWLDAAHQDRRDVLKVTGRKGVSRGDLARGEPLPGSFVFGPKFGPFYQNISGNPQHVTMDKWWTRTVYRYLGAIMDAKTGERREAPASAADRRVMREAAVRAARKLKINPADLQAVLWYHEQRLWRLFGVKNDSADFADAGKAALDAHGFRPEFDPHRPTPGRPPDPVGPDAGVGRTVPGTGRGGGGESA